MKKKRIMSFAMCAIFILSISIFLITAQAGELDDFNYTSEEKFVADYMCGLINPIGQSGVGSTYNYYSAQITHDYAFKNVAEELAKSKYQVWASIYWNKIDSFISADFKTAFGTRSYEEGIYEAILLDYISFQQDDAKIESEFKYQTFCIGYDSYGFIKDYVAVPFSDLQSAMGAPAVSSPLTNHLKDYYREVASSFEFDGPELALETSVNVVKTVYEFKKEYDQYMALCRGVHSRIECIRAMKVQAQQDGNTAFVNAADDVINKVELIMNDSTRTTAMLSEISDKAVWTVFKNMVFAPLVDKVIGADASSAIISMGVKVLDWSIGSNGVAQNNVKLLLLYTTETYAMLSAQNCKTSYLSNKTESNAAMLNSLYMYYIDFDQYATEFLRSYVESAIYGGAINYSQSHVSDDDKQLYEDYMNQIEADIHFCNTLRSVANRQRDFFQSLVETKNSESTSSDVDNQNLESINWRNLNQSVTLNKNYAVYGDVNMNGGTLNLNGHTLKIYGNLIQSGGVMNINGGRLEVWGDYRIQRYNSSSKTYSGSPGSLQMANDTDYVLVNGSFITQSSHGYFGNATQNVLKAGTLEVKGNFIQKRYASNAGNDDNFAASGTHKVILSGDSKQTVSFENYRSSGFNSFESKRNNIEIVNGIRINDLLCDITFDTNGSAVIYGAFNTKGHSFVFNGDLKKEFGSLSLSGGTATINGNYTTADNTNLGGGTLTVNGAVTQSGGTTSIAKGAFNVKNNYIQSGGVMNINGGRLEVGGDYRIQTYNSSSKAYETSYGVLQMTTDSDYVLVGGDFVTQSYWGTCTPENGNILEAGTMEVKGDFIEKYGSSYSDFVALGTHKVILSGDEKQTINFEKPNYSGFNQLEIKNKEAKLVRGAIIRKLLSDVSFNDNGKGTIYGALDLNGHILISDGSYSGEGITLRGGKAVFDGDVYSSNNTTLGGGQLTVKGNLTSYGKMSLKNGQLTVGNNFNVTGGDVLIEGTTPTIEGNLIQSSGLMNIGGGRLEVGGDYRIQTYNSSSKAYEESYGVLQMTTDSDYVLVGGDFVTQSYWGTYTYRNILKAGTLEVKGDFIKKGGSSFVASGTHRVVLSGDEKQTINFEKPYYSGFNQLEIKNKEAKLVNGAIIHKLLSDVTFNDSGKGTIYGALDLSGHTLISDGSYSDGSYNGEGITLRGGKAVFDGDVYSSNNTTLGGGQLTVKGNLTSYGTMSLKNGQLTVGNNFNVAGGNVLIEGTTPTIEGNLIQSAGVMNIGGGRLEVGGDYRIQTYNSSSKAYETSYGVLQMTTDSDYVLVGGDFVTQSYYGTYTSGNDNILKAGTMEVKGDFIERYGSNSCSNFVASGTHKVILSGDGKQNIYFADPQYSCFNILDLKRTDLNLVNGSGIRIKSLICDDITINSNGNVTIYGETNFQGHNVIINGNVKKSGDYSGNLLLSGGKLTINGDYTSSNSTLVDGGELIVNGSCFVSGGNTSIDGGFIKIRDELRQSDGTMDIGGGRLEVGGDYRIQSYNSSNQTYGDIGGTLKMANEDDYVLVGGNFAVQGSRSELIAGTLEIKGDFTQKMQYFNTIKNNFAASGTHKVILSGSKTQHVTFENYSSSHFNNLELIRPRNVGYVFNPNPCWIGTLTAPDGDYELMRWDWDGYNSATAVFGYDTYVLEKITANSDDMHSYEDSDGNIVHTATVLLNDKEYSDTKIEIKNTVDAKLAGHNLSLDGSIGVNFFMELGEDVASNENTYMHFELPNGSQSDVPITKAIIDTQTIPGKTLYVFKCEVAAKEMTDEISAQLIVPLTSENVSTPDIPTSETSGSEVLKGKRYTYTVKQYADYLFKNVDNNSDYRKAYDLIRAMVNYGVYAQEYFDHNTENPVTTDKLSMESVTAESLEQYAKNEKQGNDNVNFAGASLELLSETTLRMYFTINNAENVSFAYNGEKLQTERTGNYYYVDLNGIPSDKLAEESIVTVTDGNDTFDVGFTPMAYCYNVISRETTPTRTEALKNLMRALVLYNQEATKYF